MHFGAVIPEMTAAWAQIFSIHGAVCTDGHAVSIRAIIPVSVLLLLLALGFSVVDGQFPRACTTKLALETKTCCPEWNGSQCGEDAGRGLCSTKHTSLYSEDSQIPHEDRQCHDDRLNWPTGYFLHYCICKGYYSGFNCGECKYGYYGKNCDQKKILVRKEIRKLNDTEKQKLLRYLSLAKDTTCKDHVMLVSSDRNNHTSYQFLDVSFYDLLAWMHHYAMKDIIVNCSHTIHRNFAHQGPAFPTWHRILLLTAERYIQILTGDCDFSLPYYNWSQDKNCSICCDDYLGTSDLEGNILNSSYFSSWGAICSNSLYPNTYCNSATTEKYSENLHRKPGRPNDSGLPPYRDVVNLVKWETYDSPPYDKNAVKCFRNALEGFVSPVDGESRGSYTHNRFHGYIGGTMSDISVAANDPLFFVHHNFVDYLLEQWIRQHNGCPDKYPENSHLGHGPYEYPVPFYPAHYNRDFLKPSTEFGYTFDEFPDNE